MAGSIWMSQNSGLCISSYFVSTTMKRFAERCNMRQHITVVYGHYSNGSIEVLNKIYLQLMRALLSELRWDNEFWPWLNANVEHTINHRPQDVYIESSKGRRARSM